MFKYTKNSILDSIDVIKRIIFITLLIIQLSYISYLVYRIIGSKGNIVTNIILLVISFGYLVYQLITRREFYTLKENANRKKAKLVVKVSKYVVKLYIIVISVVTIINYPINEVTIDLIAIMLLIGAFLGSLVLDFILYILNNQSNLILNSVLYDVTVFRERHSTKDYLIKTVLDIDLEELVPAADSEIVDKITDANKRQEDKMKRKMRFYYKIKRG